MFKLLKFILSILLLINIGNIAYAKCSFNCDKYISSETNKISKKFEFKQIGLVALDVKEKINIVGQNELAKRCKKTSFLYSAPKIINDVKGTRSVNPHALPQNIADARHNPGG